MDRVKVERPGYGEPIWRHLYHPQLETLKKRTPLEAPAELELEFVRIEPVFTPRVRSRDQFLVWFRVKGELDPFPQPLLFQGAAANETTEFPAEKWLLKNPCPGLVDTGKRKRASKTRARLRGWDSTRAAIDAGDAAQIVSKLKLASPGHDALIDEAIRLAYRAGWSARQIIDSMSFEDDAAIAAGNRGSRSLGALESNKIQAARRPSCSDATLARLQAIIDGRGAGLTVFGQITLITRLNDDGRLPEFLKLSDTELNCLIRRLFREGRLRRVRAKPGPRLNLARNSRGG